MFTKILSKIYLIPMAAILLAGCGNAPVAESQPEEQTFVEQAAVVENVSTQSEAELKETEAISSPRANLTYPIVDTDQGNCYNAQNQVDCPKSGASFFGLDAQYNGNQPSYMVNDDGTVTDNVTRLMWQQDPGEKMTYDQAVSDASDLDLAGYSDWRLPSIKELYSLIQFDGLDPSGPGSTNLVPFIDTDYFNFEYGDESAGERVIDSQWATSTKYVSTTMNGNETMFGVNFADGRIKGYPTQIGLGGQPKTFFVIYVRGNTAYGENSFADNTDGTISDYATGLTWTQSDSASGMNWEASLNYCESLDTAGITNWRLPNVKELQSIVDYSRSPNTTNSAAIDPIFSTSTITNEAGQVDYPFFWSSTTHANQVSGGNAAYIAFGRALGYTNDQWQDVHGAGAQRSDPKTESGAVEFPTGHGPQGDAIRGSNYVRCLTDSSTLNVNGNPSGATSETQSRQTDPGQDQTNEPRRPGVDLKSAAAELGVTEETLRSALGAPPPDLVTAAAQLGVTEQDLIDALGIPPGGPHPAKN
jgi:hypothetical protein